MKEENKTEDEKELAEEAKHKETIEAIETLMKRYKDLFGNEPDMELPLTEIRDKIIAEMIRRNLRAYKL